MYIVNLTDFFLGDTYNEVQNGEILDFYCLNDSPVDFLGEKAVVKNTRSCLIYQAEYSVENSLVGTFGDGFCEKRVFGGSFVCEFTT
jgi:hypothetical protein